MVHTKYTIDTKTQQHNTSEDKIQNKNLQNKVDTFVALQSHKEKENVNVSNNTQFLNSGTFLLE